VIRAICFDCNGIIVDDEPIHLRLFQKVLREEDITLTRKEYFKKYLAMDDRGCFKDALRTNRRPNSPKVVKELIERKAVYYKKAIRNEIKIFPGVKRFVKEHRGRMAFSVVSGALRREIEWILRSAGIRSAFQIIISSEDVKNGKPDPDCYLNAFKKLSKLPRFRKIKLLPKECLAIEDSIHGVAAARKAGMQCLAVTNSYPAKALHRASSVVKSLQGMRINN